jgi:hypothetical protein
MGKPLWVAVGAVVVAGVAYEARGGDGPTARTSVTIWRSPVVANPWGGTTYGAYGDSIAFVTDRRVLDVPASGELSFDGVAAQIEPATVQLKSITDPGAAVLEQRFVRGLSSPDELLTRHIGKPVVVTTEKGEVNGTLRAVDTESLVIEVGAGAQKSVELIRRGEYVRDIKLTGASGVTDRPSLMWKLKTARPGNQTLEVSYRARGGLSWAPDYTATLDESKQTLDFTAIATIQNQAGVDFDDVELTLVTGPLGQSAALTNPYGQPLPRQTIPTTSYTVPRRVKLGRGDSVQIELMPAKAGAKATKIVVFEPQPDQSFNFISYPGTECYAYAAPQGTSQVSLEVAVGSNLPEGKVRLFRRKPGTGNRLDVDNEDTLKVNAQTGVARIKVSDVEADITGERKQLECNYNERGRNLREKIELKVENKSKQAHEVVIREYMYRWMAWKIESEDEKGTKAAPQTQEYRVKLPPGGKKTVTYTVLYIF